MLNVQRLRILVELKHRGTVTGVAEALNYSASAVSQQLAALAREARAPLTEPVGRRLRLTPHAEILVAHAGRLLEQMEQAEAELAESVAGLRGTVRLATFQTGFLGLVPRLLAALADHPHVRVDVVHVQPDSGFDALAVHDCDLLVGEEYPGLPLPRVGDVEVADLLADPMRLLAPRAWARASSPDGSGVASLPPDDSEATPLPGGRGGPEPGPALAAFADVPWVMEPVGNAARVWIAALCREAGFEPQVRFESPDLLVHIRLVETGHAVAVLPDLVWTALPPPGTLHALAGRSTRRVFTAVRAGAGRHPLIGLVRDRLAAVVAEINRA